MRRIRWLGWAAMIAVIVGSASVWAGKFGVHIGGSAPDTTTPTAVLSPQETSPAVRPALTRDSNTVELARSPSRRQAAPAEVIPQEQVLDSLRLFAREVMPHFRDDRR